ncbi:MAG: hypothetical protein J6W00_14380 [Lentisphaeria bacterium]|nr:hypothetical protein [Lentisphaeria bacterium]
MSRLIQKCFIFAVFLLPIAGHGIAAIAGSDDARVFLHWSMLIASLIGSGFGCLIVCGVAALRKKHDICDDLLLFAVVNSLIQWLTPAVQFVHFIVVILIFGGAILSAFLAWLQQKIDLSER